MTRYVKIIYEDWEGYGLGEQRYHRSEIKESLVPFGDYNTMWNEGLSYAENFEAFIQDSFECGFVYVSGTKAVTVLQIKAFEHYNPPTNQQPRRDNQRNSRKRGNKRRYSHRPEMQDADAPKEGVSDVPKPECAQPSSDI